MCLMRYVLELEPDLKSRISPSAKTFNGMGAVMVDTGMIVVSGLEAVIDTAASGGDEGIVIESFALLAGVVELVSSSLSLSGAAFVEVDDLKLACAGAAECDCWPLIEATMSAQSASGIVEMPRSSARLSFVRPPCSTLPTTTKSVLLVTADMMSTPKCSASVSTSRRTPAANVPVNTAFLPRRSVSPYLMATFMTPCTTRQVPLADEVDLGLEISVAEGTTLTGGLLVTATDDFVVWVGEEALSLVFWGTNVIDIGGAAVVLVIPRAVAIAVTFDDEARLEAAHWLHRREV